MCTTKPQFTAAHANELIASKHSDEERLESFKLQMKNFSGMDTEAKRLYEQIAANVINMPR